MRTIIYTFLFLLITSVYLSSEAQTLPVGTPLLHDYYRRQQLLGQVDSTISFNVQPIGSAALGVSNLYQPDSLNGISNSMLWNEQGVGKLQLLPLIWQNQYTSAFPTGYNDGSMIPNVGYQTQFSAGVYFQYKWLSIQLRPEVVYAQNKSYPIFTGGTENAMQAWYDTYNNIDMPSRFGNEGYIRFFPGQSSIRANFDPISIGFSTENLWWGPGIHNSLLMSNTAPGFPHITVNSTRPIRSNIGSFEGQVIAGGLTASGFSPRRIDQASNFEYLYKPKPESWRYIGGAIFSYQPKWVPGLSLGVAQTFVVYRDSMGNRLNDYLPFLGPGSKNTTTGTVDREARRNRDRYSSFFARWVLPSGQAEFYAEYGRNEPPFSLRDKFVEMDHSRAYVLGFRKLVPLRTGQEQLQIGFELTQLDKSRTYKVREYQSWYTNSMVRHGYTNLGQVLGAGIGPGSNVQSVSIDWFKGLKHLGILFERQEQQTDLYYALFAFSEEYRRNWTNLSATLNGEWDFNHFLLMAHLKFTNGLNFKYDYKNGPSFWNFNAQDKFNFQGQLGMIYRF